MNKNRDSFGRFAPGNTIAVLGWQGLVAKRFDNDPSAARAWVGQLGRWAYAKSFVGHQTPMMAMRFATAYAHPGQPETFVIVYRQRFEFSLNDVQPMEF